MAVVDRVVLLAARKIIQQFLWHTNADDLNATDEGLGLRVHESHFGCHESASAIGAKTNATRLPRVAIESAGEIDGYSNSLAFIRF